VEIFRDLKTNCPARSHVRNQGHARALLNLEISVKLEQRIRANVGRSQVLLDRKPHLGKVLLFLNDLE
jgi:hypothetical protein